MNTLTITAKNRSNKLTSFLVKINAAQFERLAANFGFFSKAFKQSVRRAESDFKKGKYQKIKSLGELSVKK